MPDFDFLDDLQNGKHFYQFYKNPEDHIRMMSDFFQTGLEAGEACLWLVSQKMGLDRVYSTGKKLIPKFSFYLAAEQLKIVSGEDWYLTEGVFDEDKSLGNAKAFFERAYAEGYTRVRATGDLNAVPHGDWQTVYAYERKIDAVIKAAPLICICAYPILECSISDTKAVLDTHPDGVLVSRV